MPITKAYNGIKQSIIDNVNKIIKCKKQNIDLKNNNFNKYISKFCSSEGKNISNIIDSSPFANKIYSGPAYVVRDFTVNINANIVTLYSDKSGSGKYELLKFEEDDWYRKQYIKYYLENLTEEQLEEINDKYNGDLLKKVLKIEIPDYDKSQVVGRVVNEWEDLQKEIEELEVKIEKTDNEINQRVYDLYDLTEKEIKIVEESL